VTATDLCACSLSEVSRLIAQREVSPVAVTQAVLDRIAQLEPQLNAFITVMAESALVAAQQAEREIGRGHYRGPLHGVPLSLKDLFYTKGVRTSAASRVLADFIPDVDATIVTRLQHAGAVIIGKTNMAEFAFGETHPDFGPTHNPWNLDFGTNGSSSGSAAAVAAGLGYGSFGSDTGGSIRLPAAFCGLVGLKPTYGRVSRAGVVPLSWSLDHVGPLTRTVRDCAILLEAVAGADSTDPTAARVDVPHYASVLDQEAPRVTIGVVQPAEDDGVLPEVRQATDQAVVTLRDLGFQTIAVEQPHPEQAIRALMAIMYVEASTFHLPWLRTRPEDYSVNTRERLELGAFIPGSVYVQALQARRIVIDAYRTLFREVDLLLTPASPFPSYRLGGQRVEPVADKGGDRMNGLIRFSGPFDLTGFPALTVPCGVTSEGLPIGIQLAAPAFGEELLLQVAHAYQQATASAIVPTTEGNLVV
jgi:aspartyl-tRNA(Asn)/glutamyl-tRNA(Gln) amidotransferase subunit A